MIATLMNVYQKTIFLLEDDESFSIIFSAWIEEAGYTLVRAKNIAQAKEKLATVSPPDLFWLDYYLGTDGENGLDFFRWLKANERYRAIPAIIVSITADEAKLKEFESEGVRRALSKTIANRETILATVKEVLGS